MIDNEPQAIELVGGPADGHRTTIPVFVKFIQVPTQPCVDWLSDNDEPLVPEVHVYRFACRWRGRLIYRYTG